MQSYHDRDTGELRHAYAWAYACLRHCTKAAADHRRLIASCSARYVDDTEERIVYFDQRCETEKRIVAETRTELLARGALVPTGTGLAPYAIEDAIPGDSGPTYYVLSVGDRYELHQIRYRVQLSEDAEHPYSLCAVASSLEAMRDLAECYKVSQHVDWSTDD